MYRLPPFSISIGLVALDPIEAVVDELKKNQKFTDVEQVKLNEILLNADLFLDLI